jgi:hypothetical protein
MAFDVRFNSELVGRKSSSRMIVNFPDVCLTPGGASGAPIPIPYPNFAKRARAVQQKKVGGVTPSIGVRSAVGTSKRVAGGTTAAVAAKGLEVQQIKGELNQLNMKLQALMTTDPNQWQVVLQAYAVSASALYVTLNNDDND